MNVQVQLPLTLHVSCPPPLQMSMVSEKCFTRYYDEDAEGFIRLPDNVDVPESGYTHGGFVRFLVEHVPGDPIPRTRSKSVVSRRKLSIRHSPLSIPPPSSVVKPPTVKIPYFTSALTSYVDLVGLASMMPPSCEVLERTNDAIWAKAVPLPVDREKYLAEPWKSLVRHGVPAMYRDSVWATLTGAAHTLSQRPNLYANAVERTFKWDQLRERFPKYCPKSVPYFGRASSGLETSCLNDDGERALMVIMCLAAEHFPEIEYSPEIPSIVAMLLLHCKDSFTTSAIFNLISSSRTPAGKYHLRLQFDGHSTQLRVFEMLLRKRTPSMAKLFDVKKINLPTRSSQTCSLMLSRYTTPCKFSTPSLTRATKCCTASPRRSFSHLRRR